MPTRKVSEPERVNRTLRFINLAFKDYIAARVLFNAELPLQGVFLASTSIEKYFKAIMTLRGNFSEGHLKAAHLRSVKNYDQALYNSLNESFLLFLQKCYRLRYYDNIEPGFSVCIVQRPTLAELDFAVSKLQSRFTFMRDEKRLITMYDAAISSKDAALFLNNHILNQVEKGVFIEQEESYVYEMRLDENCGLIEVTYMTKGSHDGNFLVDGLTPSKPQP